MLPPPGCPSLRPCPEPQPAPQGPCGAAPRGPAGTGRRTLQPTRRCRCLASSSGRRGGRPPPSARPAPPHARGCGPPPPLRATRADRRPYLVGIDAIVDPPRQLRVLQLRLHGQRHPRVPHGMHRWVHVRTPSFERESPRGAHVGHAGRVRTHSSRRLDALSSITSATSHRRPAASATARNARVPPPTPK